MKPGGQPTSPERTLKDSKSATARTLLESLKANSGKIAVEWASASSRLSFAKGSEFDIPAAERTDRMRRFVESIIELSSEPKSRAALEIFRSEIRAEHARSLSLTTTVKKQNLLRDIMLRVAGEVLPEMPRATAKLAIDSILDKSVEGTVAMLEGYSDMQSALSKWILSTPDLERGLEQALTRFCGNSMDYFDADFVGVFKHPMRSQEIQCLAYSSKSLAISKESMIPLSSFPLVADAIQKKRTSNSCATDEQVAKRRKLIGSVSFTHCISVPMLREEEVIGLFFVGDNSRLSPFAPEEICIAEDLSRQVLRVIQNSELFQLLSIRSRAQKALLETAASLQQEIDSEEIYRLVATKLTELVPNSELAFYVYDWDRRIGNPVYASGPWAAQIMADREFPADVGIAGYIARSKKGEIIPDTEADPRGNQIPGTPAMHTSMLAVPVIGRKDVIGVMELMRYPPETFSLEDLEIANLFANHASVALENAGLLKELRTAMDQVELSMDLLTHDIANYATPIAAYFETLRSRKNLKKEVANLVEKTSKQVEGIMRLVEMVRTLAKLREHTSKDFRKMDLKKSIEDTAADVRQRTTLKVIEFELQLPAAPMLVMADDMLRDLFSNLFYSAALSDRQDPTKLTVTAEPRRDNKNEYWWVKLMQPSRSIPDNLKSEVLRMSKMSKSELASGFGIGLAAAKGVVAYYSGMMWVSDIVKDDHTKGCVFNILIPRAT